MIHLSALEASRLLANYPKAKREVEQLKTVQQVDSLHGNVMAELVGFPEPKTELLFHPVRKWRFDYAWPLNMIALEIHGGIHSGGRHTRGKGFVEDRVKMNEATLLGWSVIEVTPEHIKTGQMRAWLLKAFDRNTNHLRTTP